jgi:hypothetical protein
VNLRLAKTIGFGPAKLTKEGSGAQATPTAGQSQSAVLSGDHGGGGAGLRNLTNRSAFDSSHIRFDPGMSIRKLLNHNNPGPIIGNITSPLFGRANQAAGTPNGEGFRRVQIRFTF